MLNINYQFTTFLVPPKDNDYKSKLSLLPDGNEKLDFLICIKLFHWIKWVISFILSNILKIALIRTDEGMPNLGLMSFYQGVIFIVPHRL